MPRGGWNAALRDRVRAVPRTARIMVDAVTVVAADIRQTKSQWTTADSIAGLQLNDDGSVEIAGSTATLVQNTVGSGNYITDLDRASPFDVGVIDWDGSTNTQAIVSEITARLHPRTNGGNPQTVATWGCQLWALQSTTELENPSIDPFPGITLYPISDLVTVAAGASEADVSFTFGGPNWPRPKSHAVDGISQSRTYVFIFAFRSDGSAADNVGWVYDNTATTAGTGPTISSHRITQATEERESFQFRDEGRTTNQCPRMAVRSRTYTAQTLVFSTTGGTPNVIDLGVVPTGTVEFLARGETPGGSSLTFDVRNDANTAWVTYTDRQTQDDLAGVGLNQTYPMRVTLTPNAGGTVSPIVRLLGARERTRTDVSDVVTVQGGAVTIDPVTLKASVGECQIIGLRDGNRDAESVMETILSTTTPADLEFDVYVGADDLSRDQWLLLETYIPDGWHGDAAAVTVVGVTALVNVYGELPKYDTATDERNVLTYANQTLATVYNDLLANQLEVPTSRIGPEVEATDQVTKTISPDTPVRGKDEVEAIARLAGGAVISDQGRITFVRLFDTQTIQAAFPTEEIDPIAVTPGYEHRVPEFVVPYNWNTDQGRYADELRLFHVAGLADFGRGLISGETRLPDNVAKWLAADPSDVEDSGTDTLVDRVGQNHIKALGTGLMEWRFRSHHAYPEIQLGDRVAIQTDRFVARDPQASRALRGMLWAIGRVVGRHDIMGHEFSIWVQSYADLFPSLENIGDRAPVARAFDVSPEAVSKDTGGDSGLARHFETGTGQDGDAITFQKTYENPPDWIVAPEKARTYVNSVSADQRLDMRLINLTVSGADIYAKVVEASSITAITDGFSAAQNTAAPENGDVSLTTDGAVAYSNLEDANTTSTQYRVRLGINATGMAASNQLIVEVAYNDGATSTNWTTAVTRQYGNGANYDDLFYFDAALGANFDIRVRISYLNNPGLELATVTAYGEDGPGGGGTTPGVAYNRVDSATLHSMTPNADDRVRWRAWESPS